MQQIKRNIGKCELYLGEPEEYLGLTAEGVEFMLEVHTQPQHQHSTGTAPLRHFVTGKQARITAELLEATWERLSQLLPDLQLLGDQNNPANRALDLLSQGGSELVVDRLRLHPVREGEDILFWRAAVVPQLELPFSELTPLTIKVEFHALIDTTNEEAPRLLRIGNTTL